MVAITGSAGRHGLRGLHRAGGLGEVAHRLDAEDVGPGRGEGGDLLGERRLHRVGRGVAVGLEELPGGAHGRRHERPARHRPLHRLDRLPVDAVTLPAEAVELEAEGRPAEGVGGDEVGPGLDVEPRHLLDRLRLLEREPLRGLARGKPPLHELRPPRPVAHQHVAALQPREQPFHVTPPGAPGPGRPRWPRRRRSRPPRSRARSRRSPAPRRRSCAPSRRARAPGRAPRRRACGSSWS